MEKDNITIGDKDYEVHEIRAYDYDNAVEQETTADRIMHIILGSSNLTEEEYKNLTKSERNNILIVTNELNGMGKSQETENSDSPKDQKD